MFYTVINMKYGVVRAPLKWARDIKVGVASRVHLKLHEPEPELEKCRCATEY